MTELLSTGQLQRSRAVREKELARFSQNVFESAKWKEVVDLSVELMHLTNNMLCKMAASTSCSEKGDEAERIRETMKDAFKVGSKIFFGNMLGPFGFVRNTRRYVLYFLMRKYTSVPYIRGISVRYK